MRYNLEILAYTLEACQVAEGAGADRIELCANPGEGGTTPSSGVIREAIRRTSIPVFPMIRPRGGDFLYSEADYAAMRQDIQLCKSLGAAGVVLGLLLPDGRVDRERTAALVELAYPMDVTFHRAFDHSMDPREALEEIIRCGCTRILTSGQARTAPEGAELIRALVEQADDRIIIMPGSGVRAATLQALLHTTGAGEYHSSAASRSASRMTYQPPLWAKELGTLVPDPDEIGAMRTLLQLAAKTY